jgi:DNA polymerase III subunit delta
MATTLKPVYLIYGDEFQVDQALRRLKGRIAAEAGGEMTTPGETHDARLDVRELDAAAKNQNAAVEAVRAAETLPFFAVTNLVVVRNVDKLKADDQRILADYAANPSPATVLVLTAAKMAKSAVLFKAVDRGGQTFEYATPKGPELAKWVAQEFKSQGKDAGASAIRHLIAQVGTDQATLQQEVKKLVAYAGAEPAVDEHAIEAVAMRNPEISIFAMVDALGHRRTAEAVTELNKLLNDGEPAQRILYMIVRQYRILIKTKGLEQAKQNKTARAGAGANAAKVMGVAPFLVDKYKAQARRYTLDELRHIYGLLKDTDIAMKTGQQEPRLALEVLVGKIATPVS